MLQGIVERWRIEPAVLQQMVELMEARVSAAEVRLVQAVSGL
jgi:hypothetical protein